MNKELHRSEFRDIRIAYFSAEIGILEQLPTYSGGLGILAGDHIRSAADLEIPLCAVTLLYHEGYFQQRIGPDGTQSESYPRLDPDKALERLPIRLVLRLQGREVAVAAWRYDVVGVTGAAVPIFFLDTDLPENAEKDRQITRRLYHGGLECRILQEAVLGFGGVRLLQELDCTSIHTYHLNEGHSAFLTLELMHRLRDAETVRKHCIFTTHTSVPAGHDLFPRPHIEGILDGMLPEGVRLFGPDDCLNMTRLALDYSRATNGVSRLHCEVTRGMFPDHSIGHVTNGVHHLMWTSPATHEVYDEYLPGWREDPYRLKAAAAIPDDALERMRSGSKERMLTYIRNVAGREFSPDLLTIGFARRAAGYKRARLLFTDLDRLIEIGKGKVQLLFAGKAHPNDQQGKALIQEVVQAALKLRGEINVLYLENYNIGLGKLLTSGVDVWLNTPLRPNEASGTSGMKAALNGVLNLSVLDGWWAEACRHGENGWGLGDPQQPGDEQDARHLYELLEQEVIPAYYHHRRGWNNMMRQSIATAADYTSQRMVGEYNDRYYRLEAEGEPAPG